MPNAASQVAFVDFSADFALARSSSGQDAKGGVLRVNDHTHTAHDAV